MSNESRNLTGWAQYEVHPSADEIAEVFWAMDAEEQAHFFNLLGGKERLVFQLQAITDNPYLTMSGRFAMSRIGEYAVNERSQP